MADQTNQQAGIPEKAIKPMLAILFEASFIASFNENIINVGLADIMNEFTITANTANLLVTGYMIVTTIVVAVIAFLLQRFSLRKIVFAGAGVFIVGSVLAIFAPNFQTLFIFRLVQAFGTGLFIPTMMHTVLTIAPKKKLGSYLAIGNCCITFGPALAPVISGLMITLFGWRTMFVVPAGVMIVVLISSFFLVKNIGETHAISLDILSLIFAAIGLSLFVYGLSEIMGNTIESLVLIVVGALVLVLFARRQRKIKQPILNLEPMKGPLFSLACIMVMIAMMTTFSLSVLLPLYFQQSLGLSALAAGVLIIIPVLAQAITAVFGGRIMDSRGGWPLLPISFGIMAIGLFGIALVSSSLNFVSVIIFAAIAFAGVGLGFSTSQTAGLKTLKPELAPFGVSIISTFIQMASAIGPSLFVGLLSSISIQSQMSGVGFSESYASGTSVALVVAGIIAVIGIVIATIQSRKAFKLLK